VAGDAALLAKAGDSDDLAVQIRSVLADDARHGDLVQRGLKRAFDFSLEAYNNGWGKIVTEVQAWLVERPSRPLLLSEPPKPVSGNAVAAELLDLPLQDEIKQLHKAAEGVLQPFTVRSGVPVIGPFIVWLRRNLTSHLREPYLDPTLRRQERFNWLVVQTMRQVNRLFDQQATQQSTLEARVARLETQLEGILELLATQLDTQLDNKPRTDAEREQALAELRHKVTELRRSRPAPLAEEAEPTLPDDEAR
jgi:hypothetical protein